MKFSLNIGDLYAILTAISWSASVILFQISGKTMSTMRIGMIKNLIGVIGFILILVFQGHSFPTFYSYDLKILILSGIFGIAVGDLLFLASLKRLGAGLNAIVSTTYTPFIFFLAYILLNETISIITYLGSFLILIGIIIGSYKHDKLYNKNDLFIGIIFGILAQVFTTASIIYVKPLMQEYSVVSIAFVRFSTGLFFNIGFLVYFEGAHSISRTILLGFKNIYLISGAFLGTFISVLLWLAGFKYTLAGRAAIYNQLSTIFIILLASIFLKEGMTIKKWIAVFCAFLGALIVSLG